MMSGCQTLDSKVVYKNKWLQLHEDSVITPASSKGIYSVLELTNDFLYIAAKNNQDKFYLIQQFRYPLKQNTWEFPAGQTDGEDPEKAAKRELREEAGVVTGELVKIGEIFEDTGVSNSKGHIFIAHKTEKITDQLDAIDGILQVKSFSFNEIHDMITGGEIRCSHTISTFYLAKSYLEKERL